MRKLNLKKLYPKSRFKLRESLTALVVLIMAAAIIIPTTASALAVNLRQNSMIEGNVITLGHLFSGLDSKADKVLGPAPRPGQEMVLNARTLLRVAVAMDLPWRPTSAAEQIVLTRAATIIPSGDIQDHLRKEIKAKGVSGRFEVAIASGLNEIILPYSESATMDVESFKFDGAQNRFDAVVVAPSKENPIIRERITGVIHRLVDVPVLRSTMKNGSVIRANDIDFIPMRATEAKHDMVLETEELINMTPRRILVAGEPIKDNEIEPPQIVSRGELVTMIYKNGPLSLTAQGKALQNGAKGDMIRVVNSSSSRTIEAQITDMGEVAVLDF